MAGESGSTDPFKAAGGAFGFMGNVYSGYAAEEAHDANAAIAIENAATVRQQAIFAVDKIRRARTKGLGVARAAYGASGVTASGSALDVMADSAAQYDLDIHLTKWESEKRAQSLEAQAATERQAGDNARVSGWFGGLSSLFGS